VDGNWRPGEGKEAHYKRRDRRRERTTFREGGVVRILFVKGGRPGRIAEREKEVVRSRKVSAANPRKPLLKRNGDLPKKKGRGSFETKNNKGRKGEKENNSESGTPTWCSCSPGGPSCRAGVSLLMVTKRKRQRKETQRSLKKGPVITQEIRTGGTQKSTGGPEESEGFSSSSRAHTLNLSGSRGGRRG